MVTARPPESENERVVARLNAMHAIDNGEATAARIPSHVYRGAIDEAIELGYVEDVHGGWELTARGHAFLEAVE